MSEERWAQGGEGRTLMSGICNVWDGKAVLGEGPIWDPVRNALWFVDIKQRRIHRFTPCEREVESWEVPAQVGWVAPTKTGALIAGLQTGLALFDPASGSITPLADVEPHLPSNRLNDACIAPDGCIWFGSMDDNESAQSGRFYHWDGARVSSAGLDPVCITNGPAVSPDGRILYHVDTAGGIVHASELDFESKVISTREFLRIDPAEGHPDGVSVDVRGNVWLGVWGGWCARLYSPEGELLREVKLPAANVTKVALGGKDMTTAYVTTARAGLSEEQLTEQPEAGSLFAFKVEVPGIPNCPALLGD